MGATLRKAWLQDGAGGMFPTELPASFPTDRSGLLVGRVYATAPGAGVELFRVSGRPVEVGIEEQFVAVPAADLAAAALTIVRSVGVTSVVVCPAGAPPEATALASLVAGLLQARRGRTAVTCGVRLPAFDVGWQVQQPVLVEDADGGESRQVWELGAGDDLHGLVDALPEWPV